MSVVFKQHFVYVEDSLNVTLKRGRKKCAIVIEAEYLAFDIVEKLRNRMAKNGCTRVKFGDTCRVIEERELLPLAL